MVARTGIGERSLQIALERTLTLHLAHRFAWQADSLLDFACGRGGDLQKWFDAGVRSPVLTPPVVRSQAGFRLWHMCLLEEVQKQPHFLPAGSICERHRPVTAGGGGGAAALCFREGASPATRCCVLLARGISCHKSMWLTCTLTIPGLFLLHYNSIPPCRADVPITCETAKARFQVGVLQVQLCNGRPCMHQVAEAAVLYVDAVLEAEFLASPELGLSVWQEPREYDAVTCMFALHYFFASEKTLHTFLGNVARNLKPGLHACLVCCCHMRVCAALLLIITRTRCMQSWKALCAPTSQVLSQDSMALGS